MNTPLVPQVLDQFVVTMDGIADLYEMLRRYRSEGGQFSDLPTMGQAVSDVSGMLKDLGVLMERFAFNVPPENLGHWSGSADLLNGTIAHQRLLAAAAMYDRKMEAVVALFDQEAEDSQHLFVGDEADLSDEDKQAVFEAWVEAVESNEAVDEDIHRGER